MTDNNKSKKTNSENDSSSKLFSLQNIIISVLNENNITNGKTISFESYVKSLYRKFISLIEIMGGDINMLKHGKKYSFTEDEVPFMKVIISQLHRGEGIIADIIDNHKADKVFSAKEVHNFIQEIIDEADRAGDDEETLKKMAEFLQTIFLVSPYHYREQCHILIDTLAVNMSDMVGSMQAAYWQKVCHHLKKEVALRIVESSINIHDLAEFIIESRKDSGNYNPNEPIYNSESMSEECRKEYVRRDQKVLEAIKRDKNLRVYIETSLGEKAEDIFGYVNQEHKSEA